MALKLIYQMFAKLLSWMVLHVRSDTANEIEILVLRHQLAVLQRRAPQPRLNRSDRVPWRDAPIRHAAFARRVVYLSAAGAGADPVPTLAADHRTVEDEIAAVPDLGWVILRPTAAVSSLLGGLTALIGPDGTVPLAFGTARVNLVDARDIGAAAAAALLEPASDGGTYTLTGPRISGGVPLRPVVLVIERASRGVFGAGNGTDRGLRPGRLVRQSAGRRHSRRRVVPYTAAALVLHHIETRPRSMINPPLRRVDDVATVSVTSNSIPLMKVPDHAN